MQNQFYKEAISATIFNYISKASEELGLQSYVIGGFVRDYVLQRGTAKDIDIVTIGSGIELAQKVAELLPNKPKVQVFKKKPKSKQNASQNSKETRDIKKHKDP